MREIEFRAWDNKREVLVTQDNVEDQVEFDDDGGGYGPYYGDEWFPAKKILSIFDYFQKIARDDRFIVEQFTGLRDKNGTEIFEGDVVNVWRSASKNGELRGKYCYPLPVVYCTDWCQFVLDDKSNKQNQILSAFEIIEVIGNTHENPELLEVEK